MGMLKLLPLIGLLALGACQDEKKAEKTDTTTPPKASTAAPANTTVAQSAGEKTGANVALGISPHRRFRYTSRHLGHVRDPDEPLALEQSNEATKAFAKQMITDHEMTSGEMKAMVQDGRFRLKFQQF